MAKYTIDAAFDAALDLIADNGDEMVVCNTEPSTYEQAHTTYRLAGVTLTPGDGNGDYTIGDGDTSGRKLTVAAQNYALITAGGTPGFVCINDTANERLLHKTTCTGDALVENNLVNFPQFDILEVRDPS